MAPVSTSSRFAPQLFCALQQTTHGNIANAYEQMPSCDFCLILTSNNKIQENKPCTYALEQGIVEISAEVIFAAKEAVGA
eukprot:3075178-Amphidinium_carterae.1